MFYVCVPCEFMCAMYVGTIDTRRECSVGFPGAGSGATDSCIAHGVVLGNRNWVLQKRSKCS